MEGKLKEAQKSQLNFLQKRQSIPPGERTEEDTRGRARRGSHLQGAGLGEP